MNRIRNIIQTAAQRADVASDYQTTIPIIESAIREAVRPLWEAERCTIGTAHCACNVTAEKVVEFAPLFAAEKPKRRYEPADGTVTTWDGCGCRMFHWYEGNYGHSILEACNKPDCVRSK